VTNFGNTDADLDGELAGTDAVAAARDDVVSRVRDTPAGSPASWRCYRAATTGARASTPRTASGR
jgi:hypothetical protein